MKRYFCLCLLLACCLLCGSAFASAEKVQRDQQLGNNMEAFGLALFENLDGYTRNLLFSPYSLYAALTLALEGAEGKTATEIAHTLALENMDLPRLRQAMADSQRWWRGVSNGSAIHSAAGLWLAKNLELNRPFQNLLKTEYQADARPLNFAADTENARKTINAWFEAKTDGKVPDMLPPGAIKADTPIVIASALQFQGTWLHPFPERLTTEEPFFPWKGESILAMTMRQLNTFPYGENKQGQWLELPYGGSERGAPAMLLFLPAEDANLPGLIHKMSRKEGLKTYQPEMQPTRVEVHLPRFRLRTATDLAEYLQGIGLRRPFTDQAEFSGICPQGLKLDALFHHAFISVTEQGTEAAAGSAIIGAPRSLMPPEPKKPVVFQVNRPFFFMIQDPHSGVPLFMGRVENPLE